MKKAKRKSKKVKKVQSIRLVTSNKSTLKELSTQALKKFNTALALTNKIVVRHNAIDATQAVKAKRLEKKIDALIRKMNVFLSKKLDETRKDRKAAKKAISTKPIRRAKKATKKGKKSRKKNA